MSAKVLNIGAGGAALLRHRDPRDTVGLPDRFNYQESICAGVQRLRVGLVWALSGCPDRFLLAESTSAFDGQPRNNVLQHLREVFRDKTIFYYS